MKRKLLLTLIITSLFILTGCSIDSWRLNPTIEEELLEEFSSFINNEEYTGYTYKTNSWSCVNCDIDDDAIVSYGNMIEDERITNIYMNNSDYLMISSDNYINQYYIEDTLYLEIGNSKNTLDISVEDLQINERHNYILEILNTIFESEDTIDEYIKDISSSEDHMGYIMLIFEFDEAKLKEDRVIDNDTSIYLTLHYLPNEDNWDVKEFFDMDYEVYHGNTKESLSLITPELDNIISELFPNNLDEYQ